MVSKFQSEIGVNEDSDDIFPELCPDSGNDFSNQDTQCVLILKILI